MKHNKKNVDSICWDCKHATGGCSWSREFEPVSGWNAEKTLIKGYRDDDNYLVNSYCVYECPLFEHD